MKPNTSHLTNFEIVENPVFSPKNISELGDPLSIVEHTLNNGLKIFMSVNPDEPRIFTQIVVRAGSKQDPADSTGLAHYLEHMMFKGTSQIGSLNWEKESGLLAQIAELYEQHSQETDPSARKALYAQIDALSGEAAQYVAANEYDKLISALGARSTNAYTSSEQTVFINDIPSNELEKWLFLESERFKMLVLRLFHTELETVYEEFNISQDNDGRKVYNAMMNALFPTHPYGTQTVIGTGDDLKNPSHHSIQRYFNTYYVPNNMAIILAGDFNPSEAITLCEQYFGSFKPAKPLPPFVAPPQYPLQKIDKIEVFGHQAESLQLAWQIDSAHTDEQEIASLISVMLYNQQAGLIDIDLIQKQQVLEAHAGIMSLAEYGAFVIYGKPRAGQSLEDVEKLLTEQVNRIKKGDFPEWLIEAVVTDFRYSQTKSLENNQSRAALLTDAFVKNLNWVTYIQRIERMKKLTKAQIVAFANKKFGENYVAIYKKQGNDPSVKHVEKPQITPINLDRSHESAFAQQFKKLESPSLKPVFIDFEQSIQFSQLTNGLPFDYLKI
ncbi:MAG: insulinase family protein [Saprospiraceae bacterium]|nr:insulinase family protein [Saprospiraceae bacterium]